MKKPKFTLVDYLIIIVVIAVVIFAFVHITSDNDDNDSESSSYDSSTLNKIVEKYLGYYNQGKVVKTSISGLNSTNNEKVDIYGKILWIDDSRGSNVKVLVESEDGNQYYAGLYKDFSNADIYLDKMSLEVDSEKYENLTEFQIKPENITSLSQLTDKMGNYTNYEISTTIIAGNIDGVAYQQIVNYMIANHDRVSIKYSNIGSNDQITITRGSPTELDYASDILGDLNGLSDDITIRVYNCSAAEKQMIENNFAVDFVKTY